MIDKAKKGDYPMIRAYLIGVHFEFPDNLDGDFLVCLSVSGAVDVAEGSVAHLLGENISFQSGIPGHFVGFYSFLGDNGLYGVFVLQFLVLPLCLSSCSTGLSCNISIVSSTSTE